jgi:hypothetical protein
MMPATLLEDGGRLVGRTALHKRFPARADLIHALASEALDLVDLGTDDVIDQLIGMLVPLGPRVEFLLRLPNLQDDERLSMRINTMDQPVIDLISPVAGHSAACRPARAPGRASRPDGWHLSTLPDSCSRRSTRG